MELHKSGSLAGCHEAPVYVADRQIDPLHRDGVDNLPSSSAVRGEYGYACK